MFRGLLICWLLCNSQKISISCEQRGLTKKNLAECVEDKGSKKSKLVIAGAAASMSQFSSPQYTSTNLSAFIFYFVWAWLSGFASIQKTVSVYVCGHSKVFFLFFFCIISVCVSSRWIYWYCLAVNLIFVHIEVHLTHVRMWSRRAIETLWLTVEKKYSTSISISRLTLYFYR